mmetsp:Transcript_22197/g.54653  ORF Transcript_22197/g.54653 Transcript_22197/m.54653 type:complete len:90 (-) Transcript_22197:307-576(-)
MGGEALPPRRTTAPSETSTPRGGATQQRHADGCRCAAPQVGSSSEKVPKKFVKKTGGADLWDDGNAQKLGHEQGSKGGHTAADVAAMMG